MAAAAANKRAGAADADADGKASGHNHKDDLAWYQDVLQVREGGEKGTATSSDAHIQYHGVCSCVLVCMHDGRVCSYPVYVVFCRCR